MEKIKVPIFRKPPTFRKPPNSNLACIVNETFEISGKMEGIR